MKNFMLSFMVLLTMFLGVANNVVAQKDVTSQYLTNAGFDTNPNVTADGVSAGATTAYSNGTTIVYNVDGWTTANSTNGNASFSGTFTYGATGQNCGVTNINVDKFGKSAGAALGLASGWNDVAKYTQTVTLPAGEYKLIFDVINRNGSKDIVENYMGWEPNGEAAQYCAQTSFEQNVWYTISTTFTLNAATTGNISVGVKGGTAGSGTTAKLFVDNVRIYRMDLSTPLLSNVDYSDLINQTTWSYNEDDGSGSTSALTTNVNKGEWTGRCVERYRGAAGHYGKKLFQTVTLPAGVYEVKAACMSAHANGVEGANALTDGTENNAYFYANDQESTYPLANATSKYMTQTVTLAAPGTIEFGIKTVAAGANWSAIGSATIVKKSENTYYLYNAEGNGWLREGNNWGTKASLKPYGGMAFTITPGSSGYKLMTPIYNTNTGLGDNLFLDNGTPCEWTIEKVSDGVYTLYNATAGGYLASDGLGNALTTVTSITAAARWNIMTKEERTTALASASESDPKDATYFITNPDFSRNTNTVGWTVTSGSGKDFGIAGDAENNNWQQWNATFDIRQNLTGLPAGTYRLEAQGFYRPGGNETISTDQNAELYAGTVFTSPVQLVASEGKDVQDNANGFTTANSNSGSTKYAPNSQADASKAFNGGAYDGNSMIFVVGNDGTITIGARKSVAVGNDWTVLDNFRLFYLGSAITETAQNAIPIPEGQMNVDVKQALLDAQEALELDPSANKFDALEAAIEDAQASIAIYQRIKTYFDNLTATQLGDIPLATFQAADVYKKYSNGTLENTGTYTDLNSVVAEWRAFAANYWSTNTPAADDDLTAFIVNQGFELDNEAVKGSPAAWTLVWGASDARLMETGEMTPKEGNWLYNLWDNSISQKRLEQTMTGLPKGHYELTAYITGFEDQTTYLMGIGGASTEETAQVTTGNNIAHTVTVKAYVTDDAGTLTIRVQNEGSGEIKTFLKVDNFHLTYKGNDFNGITLVTPTGQMNADVKEAMLVAEAAHASNPTLANLNARMAAYNTATASIAEYARIRTFMDKMNTANQRGGITEGQLQAMTFWTKYSDGEVNSASDATTGTYTSLNEAVAEYRSCISTYWGTNKAVDANMTAFIVNQGFELGNPDYWSFNTGSDTGVKATNNATYEMTNSEGETLFNSWNNKAGTLYIEQALTGLPEGVYTIKAVVAGYNDASEMVLSGNVAKLEFTNSEEPGVGTEQILENVPVTSDGKLTIRMQNTGIGNTFFKIDNVRLIYQATDAATLTLPTAVTGVMRAAAENEQTAAYTAWTNGDHSVAAYTRAYAAHAEAEISHAAYLKAQAAVDRVENLLGHTNVYTYDAYVTFYNIYNTFKAPFDARTLADNLAEQMEYQIFGNGSHHQKGVPVVPFLSSAWDDAGDYTWTDYYVNTWSHENDADGSDVIPPFIEYWHAADQGSLPEKTMTAVVKAVPESGNDVKALVRVLTTDGETPTGITLQVAPDNGSNPVENATPTWTRIGDTNYYYTTMRLTDGKADADSDGDGFGDLRIQFVVDATNNFSWLTFKNVWVDFKDKNGNAVTTDWAGVTTAVTEGNGKRLGFWGGEYAPYNNVKKLQALEALNAYKAAYEETGKANAILVNNALYTYNNNEWKQNPGEDWSDANPNNPNALELNAVSWRTNYTKSEIIPAYDYDGDGNISYTFETIIPDGWELNGRPNAYETRLIKYGVNAKTTADGDVGLFASCDSIVVFSKFDTKYGEKLGYTMPLKPTQNIHSHSSTPTGQKTWVNRCHSTRTTLALSYTVRMIPVRHAQFTTLMMTQIHQTMYLSSLSHMQMKAWIWVMPMPENGGRFTPTLPLDPTCQDIRATRNTSLNSSRASRTARYSWPSASSTS